MKIIRLPEAARFKRGIARIRLNSIKGGDPHKTSAQLASLLHDTGLYLGITTEMVEEIAKHLGLKSRAISSRAPDGKPCVRNWFDLTILPADWTPTDHEIVDLGLKLTGETRMLLVEIHPRFAEAIPQVLSDFAVGNQRRPLISLISKVTSIYGYFSDVPENRFAVGLQLFGFKIEHRSQQKFISLDREPSVLPAPTPAVLKQIFSRNCDQNAGENS